MHAEIECAVNFLCTFLLGRVPRRKITQFGEQLANLLVTKFQNRWFPMEPKKDEIFRLILVKTQGKTDESLFLANAHLGIDPHEIISTLPFDLVLSANPGEVSYSLGQHSKPRILYKNGGLNPTAPTFCRFVKSAENNHLDRFLLDKPVFGMAETPNDHRFTVETFAVTRFGQKADQMLPKITTWGETCKKEQKTNTETLGVTFPPERGKISTACACLISLEHSAFRPIGKDVIDSPISSIGNETPWSVAYS